MPWRKRSVRLYLAVGMALMCPATVLAAEEFSFDHENVMGTSLRLIVKADSPEAARRSEGRVLAEIDRLSRILSGHDRTSEFRRWQAAAPEPFWASNELIEVLGASERWRARSKGALDPRVEVLSRLWARAAAEGHEPTVFELTGSTALMSAPAWRPGARPGTIERLTDCPLTLDAIAKGYIVERACTAGLRNDPAVHGLLLNVGGDLRVQGDLIRTVGIVDPSADSESSDPLLLIEVRDRAVATSGASQRGMLIQGRRYSHVFDPRTGRPAQGAAAATVVANDSTDADALATIANVLPPEETLRLVQTVPGAECLIVTRGGDLIRSAGWARYESPDRGASRPPESVALVAASEPPAGPADSELISWSRDFELAVDFEINAPEGEGRRYRRPYLAIWIEDEKGQPVRTLVLWVSMGGAGPFQWIPDLKRWYRADQLRKQKDRRELVFTMARPTRPPGKYRAIWDGKDDRGKPLPAGSYTVQIDAAREHGTYQNLRGTVTVGGPTVTAELPGGVEIRSATITYRPKTPSGPPR